MYFALHCVVFRINGNVCKINGECTYVLLQNKQKQVFILNIICIKLVNYTVTVQKARDPIASEKQIVFIRQLQNTVEVR